RYNRLQCLLYICVQLLPALRGWRPRCHLQEIAEPLQYPAIGVSPTHCPLRSDRPREVLVLAAFPLPQGYRRTLCFLDDALIFPIVVFIEITIPLTLDFLGNHRLL